MLIPDFSHPLRKLLEMLKKNEFCWWCCGGSFLPWVLFYHSYRAQAQINFLNIMLTFCNARFLTLFSNSKPPKKCFLSIPPKSLPKKCLKTNSIIGSMVSHWKKRCNGVSLSSSGFIFMLQKVYKGLCPLTNLLTMWL